jgi:hypothetical protein
MTSMLIAQQVPAQRRLSLGLFLKMALLALLTHLLSTELHECIHLVIGRLEGLPAHFLAATSVGLTPAQAANASPAALALMNGVAPIATMILGVIALFATPTLRAKGSVTLADFCGWWAIFGVPYIGLQTMVTSATISVRGNGADFAAVIGGYFGVSAKTRAIIALLGFLLYIASGFWLRIAVVDAAPSRITHSDFANLRRSVPVWRFLAAAIPGAAFLVMTLRGATMLLQGNSRGLGLLVLAPLAWATVMGLLTCWSRSQASAVRDQWILPGLLASLILIVVGLLTNSDFTLDGLLLTAPLFTTAWIAGRQQSDRISETT